VLTLITESNPSGDYTARGRLHIGNDPVPGAAITLTLTGAEPTAATTDTDGQYSQVVPVAAAGDYTLTATTPASAYCKTPVTETKTIHAQVVVELQLDQSHVNGVVGKPATISGRLVSRGQPVTPAYVTTTTSWNGENGSWTTDDNGVFVAPVATPDDGNPAEFSVTVVYPGDGYYPAVEQIVTVSLTAPSSAASSTAPAATAPVTTAPSQTAATAPTTATDGDDGDSWSSTSRLFIVFLIFIVVAALAIGTFLIIAVMSRQRRGLAADERRGFGSDFGSATEPPSPSGTESANSDETSLDQLLSPEFPPDDQPPSQQPGPA
jgi:hypothetical protein